MSPFHLDEKRLLFDNDKYFVKIKQTTANIIFFG